MDRSRLNSPNEFFACCRKGEFAVIFNLAREAAAITMRSFKTSLRIFVVLACITVSSADLQAVIHNVEELRQKSQEYLRGDAYERALNLPNDSVTVIDMYTTFGRLFLDGQLGSCKRKAYPSAPCVILINGGSDANAQLTEKAALLLSDVEGLKGESPFSISLSNPSNNRDASYIFNKTRGIFAYTWSFYDYFSGQISKSVNASEGVQTDLEYRCSVSEGWVAKGDDVWISARIPRADDALNVLYHDVAPDCEVAYVNYLRSVYVYYARDHGFVGGDSNRCLQNFVIRYNNYDEKAYEAFVGELHKYLFQEVTIYGLCTAFSNVSDDERARRKEWVKEKLTTISSQLLKAREVFEEASLCQLVWPATKVSLWWANSSCLPQEKKPTSKGVHTIVTDAMILYAGGVKRTPGSERPTRYQGLIEYVVYAVKREYETFAENGSIEGVMYLPYEERRKGLYCALTWPDKANYSYVRQNYIGASHFVKWTEHPTPPEVLRSRIAFVKDRSNEDIIWNAIFDKYDEDLCEQVKTMMRDTTLTRNGTYLGQTDIKESSGFTAVIAVRCTNEFVWYELGWRYYSAAATTASDYVVSRAHGEYSNSCGQLIFLP